MFDRKAYMKDYCRRYRDQHSQEIKANIKAWKKKNRDHCNKKDREYRNKNKKRISNQAKIRRDANKNRVNKWYTDYRQSNIQRYLSKRLSNIKKGKKVRFGKNRILDFDLTLEYLLELWEKQTGKCAITGYQMKHEPNSLFSCSIDRVNSALGYTKDNVQLVCMAINFAKNNYPNEQMIEFWNFRNQH